MPKINSTPTPKKRQDVRFEKEAAALQKNLEKRKLQKKQREQLKIEKQPSQDLSAKETHHGQDKN